MSGSNHTELGAAFEEFRRSRHSRRLENGSRPARDVAASVWEQLEEADNQEVRSETLSREVHEFFADATRTAAGIVQQLAETQEEKSGSRVRSEIQEFLEDVINRAGVFMKELQGQGFTGVQQQELEARMGNLVGRALDQFRAEGTARVEDKHFGQDPLGTRGDPIRHPSGFVAEAGEVTELHTIGANGNDASDSRDIGDGSSLAGLPLDPARLRVTLRSLVESGVLLREEAREMYRAMMARQQGSTSSTPDG